MNEFRYCLEKSIYQQEKQGRNEAIVVNKLHSMMLIHFLEAADGKGFIVVILWRFPMGRLATMALQFPLRHG